MFLTEIHGGRTSAIKVLRKLFVNKSSDSCVNKCDCEPHMHIGYIEQITFRLKNPKQMSAQP
jgi:hypothetical protein